jgi:hypothetical protein
VYDKKSSSANLFTELIDFPDETPGSLPPGFDMRGFDIRLIIGT